MNTEDVQIYVAKTSAIFDEGGVRYRITKGRTTAHRGARILKGREHMFAPLVIDFDIPRPRQEPKRGPGRPRKAEVVATAASSAPKEEKKETEETQKVQ